MKTEHFGSQFFMGTVVKKHPEYPLHFLQGLWGSAFSILIHRVLDPKQTRKKMKDEIDIREMHEIMDEQSMEGICEDAVFYRTYPLLYCKFENMVICSLGNQHYQKIIYFFNFSIQIGDQSSIIKNI